MNANGAGVVEGDLAQPAISTPFWKQILAILAHKPWYKFSTDWAKNCFQKWSNNRKSTTILKNQMSLRWNWFSTVNKIIKLVFKAPEEKYQVRWDVYGALAAVESPVRDGSDDRVRCFFDYGSYDVKIGRNEKKFYYTFNYF